MVQRLDMESHLQQLLSVSVFKDYGPNGLQVEGKPEVLKLVSGVTASLALIEAAVAEKADAVLVHHGLFWRGHDGRVTGWLKKRLALLLAHEAGTNPTHRAALTNPEFTNTTVTCAFSGRYARGLENDFTRAFEDVAPVGYPEINHMTTPIRAAAVALDDPHGTSLWAGTAYRAARSAPAADIIADLASG